MKSSSESAPCAETKTKQRGKGMQYGKTLLFLAAFLLAFAVFAVPMGLANMLTTLMNTAYQLLMNTAFYIMALAVIAGAISALLVEFGVIELLNKLLSPLMRPLFGMPGAAALGIVTTYFSDNPAILSLANDNEYRKYFKAYQIPALTNIGTGFGMGLIVTTFMLSLHDSVANIGLAVLCGNLGAVAGSILSTRLMLLYTAKALGKTEPAYIEQPVKKEKETQAQQKGLLRILDALMKGGKTGVEMGLGIIPGVLVICSLVMMLTNGPSEGGAYTGAAYEGIGLLPLAAGKIDFILKPLFGFSSSAGIAIPVTALGSAGAALGVIPNLVTEGLVAGNDVAVFTAMCMCWSGYLSTHVSMMDVLNCSKFTGKAIFVHTLGGLFAGFAAHWMFTLVTMLL